MSIASRIEEIETHIGDVYDTIDYSYDTTGVNKNIINIPKYLKKGYIDIINNGTDTLYSNFPKVSGIGTNLSLTPTYEAPMKLNEIQGDTFQQTYKGNNLLNPIPNTLPNTLNGISVTRNTDGSLDINGTATSNWASITNKISTNLEPNTYKFLINSELTHTIVLRLTYSDETYSDLNILAGSKKREITTTKTIVSYYVYLILNEGTTYSEKVYLQLKLSSSSEDYEPYVGGTASPNPDYPQAIQNVTGLQNIEVCGKNLFDKQEIIDNEAYLNKFNASNLTTNSSGISWEATGNDSYISLPATITGGYGMLMKVNPNTSYTLSFDTNYELTNYIHYIKGDYTFISRNNSLGHNSNVSFTTPSNCRYIFIRFGVQNQTENTINITNIQIEKGSTATSYEEYKGQNFELNLGKNLFDKDNANIVEGYINAPSGSITAYSERGVVWIQCQPNTTYTISKISSARFAVSTYPVKPEIGVSSSINNAIRNDTATNITITSGANDNYLGVWLYNAEEDTLTRQQIIDTLQIEKSPKATSYSPYFTPIELNKIGNYQDYIYKSNGDWYIHKEIEKTVLNGSEDWLTNTSNGRTFMLNMTYPNRVGKSNRFNYSNEVSLESKNVFYFGNQQINFVNPKVNNTLINTLEDWKLYLKEQYDNSIPVLVYHILATPTNTLITNTELIEDLETLYTAKSQEGTTNISITSEDLEMILNISALKSE